MLQNLENPPTFEFPKNPTFKLSLGKIGTGLERLLSFTFYKMNILGLR